MTRWKKVLGLWTLLLGVVGGTATAAADVPTSSRERARALASDLHASFSPRLLAARLSRSDYEALLDLARDPGETLYVRSRALGLAGLRPGADAEKLWSEARRWPEQELRVQAAWAQGMARIRSPKAISFAQNLLADPEVNLREVGAHLLFLIGSTEARAAAKTHLSREKHARVRALIRRRLLEHARGKRLGLARQEAPSASTR